MNPSARGPIQSPDIEVCGKATFERLANPSLTAGECDGCADPVVWRTDAEQHLCLRCALSDMPDLEPVLDRLAGKLTAN